MRRFLVHFSGMVQGVGFRMTVNSIARHYPVTGYVRNLPDGRVELVAEGVSEQLTEFVGAIRGRMSDYISDVTIDPTDPTDEFTAFEIRY